jgi:hypothetical protein
MQYCVLCWASRAGLKNGLANETSVMLATLLAQAETLFDFESIRPIMM